MVVGLPGHVFMYQLTISLVGEQAAWTNVVNGIFLPFVGARLGLVTYISSPWNVCVSSRDLHPWSLIWNLKTSPWEKEDFFWNSFHVKLSGWWDSVILFRWGWFFCWLLWVVKHEPLHSSAEFWIPIIASRRHGNLRETGPPKTTFPRKEIAYDTHNLHFSSEC